MKEPICDKAGSAGIRDKQWLRHATDCRDCGELLKVSEWMTDLAARTQMPRYLPTAGFLLVKSRIRERLAAAERVDRPVYVVTGFAGLLFAVVIVGLVRSDTPLGSMIGSAVTMIASQAGSVVIAAVLAAIVCGLSAHLLRGRKE
ncbi:MAG TPA: hypothetical protein VNA22_00585 [Pyrinomonadaceae bacterium]|nr:hypothetical protein [Pyrinomonadaceae bacterium]